MEPLRHISNPQFGAVIFRREGVQIFNEGGLWDEAMELYPMLGARSNRNEKTFFFPSGAKIGFDHLQRADDVKAHQGSQIALIGWDELTHFLASQFWYMFSRNRSKSGVRPYIRASTNPDPDSWVADLIAWWIDQDELLPDGSANPRYGLPIPERSGVVRYFVRENGEIIWGDSPADVIAQLPFAGFTVDDVKSLTFIPASLEDNQVLMKADPGYRANLLTLDPVEKARLLGGNWKIKAAEGLLFRRGWVTFVDAVPRVARRMRYWDRAATEVTKDNPDPDWTVGVLMAITDDGQIYIEDVVRERGGPLKIEQTVKATAELDRQRYGMTVTIGIEQDPGAAGKSDAANYVRLLQGFTVRVYPVSTNKVTRFGPFSAQAEAHNVHVRRADWNHAYLSILEKFPSPTAHDDDVDATSGAYNALMAMPVLRPRGAAAAAGPSDADYT
ncbi:phage terminase large subunit [Deinococcus multiflagellatus]|nr:phage terminase large subunit [Deinococcus multiflagellatus]